MLVRWLIYILINQPLGYAMLRLNRSIANLHLFFSRRFCKFDRMRIPNMGERVPYVIIYGEPGKPLIQSVRSPDEVLKEKWLDAADCQNAMSMRPNAAYYITKVIVPALSRCLSLVGADVMSWYVCLKNEWLMEGCKNPTLSTNGSSSARQLSVSRDINDDFPTPRSPSNATLV